MNEDGLIDVLDVVLAAKIAIGRRKPTDQEYWISDTTNDGRVDAADVMGIVNIITREELREVPFQ